MLTRMAVGALLVAACGNPTNTTTTPSDSGPSMTVAPTTTAPPTTTSTIPPVDPPAVEATFPQSGAAAPLWDDQDYGSVRFATTLAGLADAGARWVTLIPTWYQSDPGDSEIFRETGGRTTTDEALLIAINEAQSLGMEVILKPHVDLSAGGFRGGIEPSDEQAWFDSYTNMIVGYATMAEENGVAQFVVGTELAGTSGNEEAWRQVVSSVRSAYSGPITYAANHDEYVDVEWWDAVDFIGVDAYFPLSSTPTTVISDLVRTWESISEGLEAVADEFDRAIVFTEVGYPSQEGGVVAPFNPFGSDVPSAAEQAAGLESMLTVVGGEPWFGGFHWWMWFVESNATEAELSYMPEGKPAGAILSEYWATH